MIFIVSLPLTDIQILSLSIASEIRNIKKYLLAMLFNAPSTINGYYTALVAHDMNTGKI